MSITGNGDKNKLQDKSLPMSIKPASEAYVKYGQWRREKVNKIGRGLCQSTQQAKPMSRMGNGNENKL